MFHLIRPGVVLSIALLAAACDVKVGENGISLDVARGKATDDWKRTYNLSSGGRLEIVNINGLIEASPATGAQVEVVAHREVRAGSDEAAKEQLAKAEMLEDVGADHVRIELKTNKDNGGGLRNRSQVNVTYRVSVPPGLNVSFRTENGGLRLENIQGRLTLSSTNGQVVGRGLSGSVDAATVNGGIEINLQAISGDSKVVTVNGPATLTLAPGLGAQLDASAVNGGVMTQDGLAIETSERSPRRVVGRLNKGGPTIIVQTTNGGVRVGTSGSFGRGSGRGRRGRESAGG